MNDGQFYITDIKDNNNQNKFCFKFIEYEYIISLKYTELYKASIYVNNNLLLNFSNNNNNIYVHNNINKRIFINSYLKISKDDIFSIFYDENKSVNNNNSSSLVEFDNEYNIMIFVNYNNRDIFEYNRMPLKDYVLNYSVNNKVKFNNLFNSLYQLSIWISSIKSVPLINNYKYKKAELHVLKDSINERLNLKTNEINSKVSNILLDKKTVDEITIYFDYFRDKDLRNTLNMSCIKKDIYQDYNYKLYELKDNINSSVYNNNDDKNYDLIEEINYNDCTNNILIDYYNKLSDNSNNDDHNNYNFINFK